MLLRQILSTSFLLACAALAVRGLDVDAATPHTTPERSVGSERIESAVQALQRSQKKKDVPRPALDDYELGRKNLALGGYDPTSYFPEYGGEPKKGSTKVTATHRGVLYRFTSDRSRKAFLADPDRFEPMYGGWCAWAIAKKKPKKVEPTASAFTIEGGRLYLFYNGMWDNTKKRWVKGGGAPKLKARADKNWTKLSGEAVRADRPAKKVKGAKKKAVRGGR